MSKVSVYILPGFAEGRWHTRRLLRALEPYGYYGAPNALRAQVVITHSAGCFFLPNTPQNTKLILINPPFWPGKPIIISAIQKIYRDVSAAARYHKLGFWLHKTAWNLVYIGLNLLRVVRIAHFVHRQNFHEALRAKDVTIIRNDNDPWLMPHPEQALPPNESFRLVRTPGEHEDCWLWPEKHAEIIDQIIQAYYQNR